MKYELRGNDQLVFSIIVYPTNNESGPDYHACNDAKRSDNANELQQLTDKGDTAMAAIAYLFHQADRLMSTDTWLNKAKGGAMAKLPPKKRFLLQKRTRELLDRGNDEGTATAIMVAEELCTEPIARGAVGNCIPVAVPQNKRRMKP